MNSVPQVPSINLSKIRLCEQDWEKMKVTEGGRICEQCSRKIVDLSRASDREIEEAHFNSPEPLCAYYRQEQLSPLQNQHGRFKQSRLRAALVSLAGLLTLPPLYSQTPAAKPHYEQNIPPSTPEVKNEQDSSSSREEKKVRVVYGKVYEKRERELIPVPFASVLLEGTDLRVTADVNGYYVLKIDAFPRGEQVAISLLVRYVGYQELREILTIKDSLEVNFTLGEELQQLVGFSVVMKAPFHRRLWGWIKRPFVRRKH
jgi:hypothetical protein